MGEDGKIVCQCGDGGCGDFCIGFACASTGAIVGGIVGSITSVAWAIGGSFLGFFGGLIIFFIGYAFFECFMFMCAMAKYG